MMGRSGKCIETFNYGYNFGYQLLNFRVVSFTLRSQSAHFLWRFTQKTNLACMQTYDSYYILLNETLENPTVFRGWGLPTQSLPASGLAANKRKIPGSCWVSSISISSPCTFEGFLSKVAGFTGQDRGDFLGPGWVPMVLFFGLEKKLKISQLWQPLFYHLFTTIVKTN